jgi:hypothetical protein
MCDPVSLGVGLLGAVASQALTPKAPKMPQAPKPEAPPQAAQAPDEAARRASAGAALTPGASGGPGASSTLLTGPSGVSNDLLNLGKNVLLGGSK